jgi:hypothetical protein
MIDIYGVKMGVRDHVSVTTQLCRLIYMEAKPWIYQGNRFSPASRVSDFSECSQFVEPPGGGSVRGAPHGVQEES